MALLLGFGGGFLVCVCVCVCVGFVREREKCFI